MSDYSSFMDRSPTCSEQIAEASISLNTRVKQLLAGFQTQISNRIQRRVDNKAFKHMIQLDDNMLKDIGISRGDVIWAGSLPVNTNASLELAKLAMVNKSRMTL